MAQIHGSCVEIDGGGVLLRGGSGSGKSDLSLRLIEAGARLVADDRVDLRADQGAVYASAPSAIAGLLEVRGLGLFELGFRAETIVRLVVDLTNREQIERLPVAQRCQLEKLSLPLIALAPFDGSAIAKIHVSMQALQGHHRCRAGALRP